MSGKLLSLVAPTARRVLGLAGPALVVGMVLVSQAQALTRAQILARQQAQQRAAAANQVRAVEAVINAELAKIQRDVSAANAAFRNGMRSTATKNTLLNDITLEKVIRQQLANLNAAFGGNRFVSRDVKNYVVATLNRLNALQTATRRAATNQTTPPGPSFG